MAALEPGATLAHYRILQRLGQGGQAAAFKAEDTRLGRPVVLKTLRPELAANDEALRRFRRAASFCALLEHPNIAALYDVGEADGVRYIVMQYVEGRTLRELLAAGPLETGRAVVLATQMADAMAVAHMQGVAHRDLKPANVVVTAAGQAKILDFGLAGAVVEDDPYESEAGVPYGSLGYSSPEQARGAPADHRSDVFSLGIVLYEMFTGHRPFPGRHPLAVLNAIIHQPAPPLVRFNPRVPPALQPILDRALAKDPGDRFQTMAAFRDELKAVLRQLGREEEPIDGPFAPGRAGRRLSGTLGRVLGRFRHSLPARAGPPPAEADAGAGPVAWERDSRATLAVLPFHNLAQDPKAAFYSFALADGLITELAQLGHLVVRPSSYIARYANQDVDPRRVAQDLAVSHVLTGAFIRTGDRFRVSTQLLAGPSGEIVWSEKLDFPTPDLISIQDRLAEGLLASLQLRLSVDDRASMERRPTASAEAYEFYSKGRDLLYRYVLQTLEEADLDEAIQMFHEAVGLDDRFALAHAALARCYVLHAQGYGGSDYYVLADRSLRRALELEPELVEARLQMVYVDLHEGDKDRAHRTVEELRRTSPHDPAVLFVAAMLYRLDGLYEQALEAYDLLLAINPGDVVVVSFNRARIYTHQHLYDQAVAELERARRREPEHPLVKTFLAIARFNQGLVDEAQALVEDVLRQHPTLDVVLVILAWCLGARGEHEQARALVTERVLVTAAADHDVAFWLASFYAMEGMTEEALDWVRRAVRMGNENYPLFAGSRKLDPLRPDPRFQQVMGELRQRWERRVATLTGAAAPSASSR